MPEQLDEERLGFALFFLIFFLFLFQLIFDPFSPAFHALKGTGVRQAGPHPLVGLPKTVRQAGDELRLKAHLGKAEFFDLLENIEERLETGLHKLPTATFHKTKPSLERLGFALFFLIFFLFLFPSTRCPSLAILRGISLCRPM